MVRAGVPIGAATSVAAALAQGRGVASAAILNLFRYDAAATDLVCMERRP
jgi:hypothetical protein